MVRLASCTLATSDTASIRPGLRTRRGVHGGDAITRAWRQVQLPAGSDLPKHEIDLLEWCHVSALKIESVKVPIETRVNSPDRLIEPKAPSQRD
jgi:hypothetical protein